MGLKIAKTAVEYAENHFNITANDMVDLTDSRSFDVSPSSVRAGTIVNIKYSKSVNYDIAIKDMDSKVYYNENLKLRKRTKIELPSELHSGIYYVILRGEDSETVCHRITVLIS